MQTAKWMLKAALVAAAVSAPWTALGEGLKPNVDTLPWARWQARLAVGAPPTWRASLDGYERSGLSVSSVSLMGDFYFFRSLAAGGVASGFRATSGLIVGPRSALWTARPGSIAPTGVFSVDRRLFETASGLPSADGTLDGATLPYLGIGYSGLSARGGWGFSADLGLVALAPGHAVKLGRVLGGTQGLDDLLRDLRLSPVIQLGVSYSF
jgi:hypothetical protein